jgi:hypothetical protein
LAASSERLRDAALVSREQIRLAEAVAILPIGDWRFVRQAALEDRV